MEKAGSRASDSARSSSNSPSPSRASSSSSEGGEGRRGGSIWDVGEREKASELGGEGG